jgi:hypothetical protein
VRPHDAKPAGYADNGKGFDPQSERFARDSALEQGGFEPLVPLRLNATNAGERDKKIAMTPLRRIGK